MTNPALVQVFYPRDQLSIQLRCLFLGQTRVSHDEIEQLTTICIFHYHKEFLVSFDNLNSVSGVVSYLV